MTIQNPYASLLDYTRLTTPRGQTIGTDSTADTTVSDCLAQAAREIETMCGGRTFYPRVETRVFNAPVGTYEITLDDDLLEVLSVTNGDGTAITSYLLKEPNYTPYYALSLPWSSSIQWQANSSGDIEQVVQIAGVWGYRERYGQQAWTTIGTLGASISSTTALTFTMTAGHTLVKDSIVRIDNELLNVSDVSTNTVTVIQRGDNGSTAATHTSGTAVKLWNVMPEIKRAALMLAEKIYMEYPGITVTIDGIGGVQKTTYLAPDVSAFARRV